MTISLIIPVYNEERYLARCLKSIAAQTLKPFEVILVDNNSTDKSTAIAAKYDFVKVVRETQQGTVYARTAGFDRAIGDLLVRIDADVRLPADWLEKLANAASRKPDSAAFTGSGTFYDAPWPRLTGVIQVLFYQFLQFPAMRGYTLWGATMAIRRDAWQQVRSFCHRRTDIDEDIDLTLQLNHNGLRVTFLASWQAQMSLRRNQTHPAAVATYLATWPRNYIINGRLLATVYITILTAMSFVLTTVAWFMSRLFAKNR